MSRGQNTIKRSEVSTTPITLKYSSSFTSESFSQNGITINRGINSSYSTNPIEYNNYKLVQQLYYNNYITGSVMGSSSFWNSDLQSTAANGTFDDDYRYFPTFTEANISVIAIPRTVFGEQISRKSLRINGTDYDLVDDGNGNVIDSKNGNTRVGNVLYSQGIVVITDSDYQNALIPVVEPSYDYYNATVYPCSSCTAGASGDVAFISGTPVTIGSYYLPETADGNSYRVYAGPFTNYVPSGEIILNSTEYASCATACAVTTTTTTSTTTSTTTAAPTTTTSTTTSTTTAASTTTSTTTAAPTTTSTTTAAPTTTTTTTAAPTTTTTSTTTSTTTVAFDVLAGSFTVVNSAGGFAAVSVDLGGYGATDTVNVGSSKTFTPSGNMTSPAVITISSVGLTDPVNISTNTVACSNATPNTTGGGTTTVTITITPTNYNGSTDSMSGTITVLTS